MSYQATWQHIRQLTLEAGYTSVVKQGSWIWIYDNLNFNQKVCHERAGKFYFTITIIPWAALIQN